MKNVKLNSELFADYGLNENASNTVIGGISTWTNQDDDSTNKTGYDVTKISKDKSGKSTGEDSFHTGATNRDRPLL